MSNACDKCGLEDPECKCYIYSLQDRIEKLEIDVMRLAHALNLALNMIEKAEK